MSAMRLTNALACVVVLAFAAAGCKPDVRSAAQGSVARGEAQRAVQAMLDATPQCADLFSGDDPIRVRPGWQGRPGVRALVAAGLITPGPPASPSGRIYEATATGRAVIRRLELGQGMDRSELCYAHRKVTKVWLKASGATNRLPQLGYTYVLVDAPAWTRRADVQAAFPFLQRALAGTYAPDDFIWYADQRWKNHWISPILPPQSGVKEEFFF